MPLIPEMWGAKMCYFELSRRKDSKELFSIPLDLISSQAYKAKQPPSSEVPIYLTSFILLILFEERGLFSETQKLYVYLYYVTHPPSINSIADSKLLNYIELAIIFGIWPCARSNNFKARGRDYDYLFFSNQHAYSPETWGELNIFSHARCASLTLAGYNSPRSLAAPENILFRHSIYYTWPTWRQKLRIRSFALNIFICSS